MHYISAFQPFSLWCTLKNLVTSSCTLCLKFEMGQKATLKLPCITTIALQSALRITQDRAQHKFKKLSLMTFLLLHFINQDSKLRNDIFFNCSPKKEKKNKNNINKIPFVSQYRSSRNTTYSNERHVPITGYRRQRWKPVGSTGRSGRDSSTGRSSRLKNRSNSPFWQLKDI